MSDKIKIVVHPKADVIEEYEKKRIMLQEQANELLKDIEYIDVVLINLKQSV